MSLPACSHCVFAARARAHGAATEWMISALAVFMVGLLCLEAAWWQIHRLRLSVALMEAGRAASRHDSNAFSDIDRTMRHAFAHAWHSPPRRGGLCRQASRPLPCWTLTRVPARPGAPSATLRLHAHNMPIGRLRQWSKACCALLRRWHAVSIRARPMPKGRY